MPMNITKLRADIKDIAKEIRDQKAILRESGQPRLTWKTYRDLECLKARATKLCALRAHLRGRLHQPKKMGAEEQGQFVASLLEQYELPPEVVQAAA